MTEEILNLSATQLSKKIAGKELTAMEALEAVLKRIKETEGSVQGFVTVFEDEARQFAKTVDAKIAGDESLGPLAGVPVAIKDNMCMTGIPTTCSSKILKNFVPTYTATAVKSLLDAGAVPVGKANMDEFAMGSSTENSALMTTRNPWDTSRVPGGSSGGSAAAVAADEAFFALGSDTGGSIRQPASFCGVVGMKPTYGLVSRYGLVAFASSLDQIGPLTKTVEDCALVLNTIVGHDPKDSTSIADARSDYLKALGQSLDGVRLGAVKELTGEGIEAGVKRLFDESVSSLEKLGAVVEEVSLPSLKHALPAYYIIAPSEASSNLARFDGVRYGYRAAGAEDMIDMYKQTRQEGFGDEVKRRIMLGTYALSAGYYEAYYGRALKVRTKIIEDFNSAFSKFDALISPTAPSPAFKIGEKTSDPWQMYLSDICTIPINMAGVPAVSLPCGLDEGLPVGLQIIGPALGEPTILRVADAFAKEIDFKDKPAL